MSNGPSESPLGGSRPSLLKTLGGGAAAIGGVLTLIFLLFPHLRPGYSEPERSGQVSSVEMSYGTQPTLVVKARIKGLNKKTCSVRYSIAEAGTGNIVPGINKVAAGTLRPDSNDDQANLTFYMAMPNTPGRYFARVYLLDPNGTELDARNSTAFDFNN